MSESHGLSEKRFENLIGTLLRVGVVLAAVVVATGGILYLIKYGATKPDYRIFRGEQSDSALRRCDFRRRPGVAFARTDTSRIVDPDCDTDRARGILRSRLCEPKETGSTPRSR